MNNQEQPVPKKKTGAKTIVLYIFLLFAGSIFCIGTLAARGVLKFTYKKEVIVAGNVAANEDGNIIQKIWNKFKNFKQGDTDVDGSMGSEQDYAGTDANGYDSTEGGIHRYELYVSNLTWTQALQKCWEEENAYLARINSQEEYEYIVEMISTSESPAVIYNIGARRDPGTEEYYWVDRDNNLYGTPINGAGNFIDALWMDNEPSFMDVQLSNVDEDKVALYKTGDQWKLNDVCDGLTQTYDIYSGKVGYIVEYED